MRSFHVVSCYYCLLSRTHAVYESTKQRALMCSGMQHNLDKMPNSKRMQHSCAAGCNRTMAGTCVPRWMPTSKGRWIDHLSAYQSSIRVRCRSRKRRMRSIQHVVCRFGRLAFCWWWQGRGTIMLYCGYKNLRREKTGAGGVTDTGQSKAKVGGPAKQDNQRRKASTHTYSNGRMTSCLPWRRKRRKKQHFVY